MATTANNTAGSARQAALARRRALSLHGKAGLQSATAQTTASRSAASAVSSPVPAGGGSDRVVAASSRPAVTPSVGRAASLARRRAMAAKGKAGISSADRVRSEVVREAAQRKAARADEAGCDCGCRKGEASAQDAGARLQATPPRPAVAPPRPAVQKVNMSPARAASLARRRAMSSRGKAGITGQGVSAAQTARAVNPQLSGRELAKVLRAQRSQRGAAGEKRSAPVGRQRQRKKEDKGEKAPDAYWKVGVSETLRGQEVTGTVVGRSAKTTGDDHGVCRPVTGTEYLGADIFREFCQSEPSAPPPKVRVTTTLRGQPVTGTEVGRSPKVTGDEPGTCDRVTGTEYLSTEQLQQFCGDVPVEAPVRVTTSHTARGNVVTVAGSQANKVTGDEPGAARALTGTQYPTPGNGRSYPEKVGVSRTARGEEVTGTLVGRSPKVTGDEPGSCKRITGDDYVGAEQYQELCGVEPEPQDAKVGVSQTLKGRVVTGTMSGHSAKVTGSEPGLCKAVTGTPYAGAEQYREYCPSEVVEEVVARERPGRSTPGPVATGTQPGVNGRMTGAERGACEPVTGTPYVGADQYAAACPSTAAEPGSPDFPQMLAAPAPTPAMGASAPANVSAVTSGVRVTGDDSGRGHITGPFGKASGKVTGTEEARFGRGGQAVPAIPEPQSDVDGRPKGRITGEGMEAGPRITGDDWARGDRVTGTEGSSAMRRNPTRRGQRVTSVMPPKRNEELPEPVSKVTGGTGQEDKKKGPLVTYSGGARG